MREGRLAPNTEGGCRNLIFNHIVPRLGSAALTDLSVYPILYVGLASGLRRGELISLPWAAVDICGQRVVLEKRWAGLPADKLGEVFAISI